MACLTDWLRSFAGRNQSVRQAKDQFDASAIYDTLLTFQRDATGKVTSVLFQTRDGKKDLLTGSRV